MLESLAITLLQKRQLLTVLNVTLSGAMLGRVAFYAIWCFLTLLMGYPKLVRPTMELLNGALFGVAVALPFSLIAEFPLVRVKSVS